jgi:hypothetical protein
MRKDTYNILITKLDEFIRKYYRNLLIRGGIFFLALMVVFFLIVILLEYFGRFNTMTRAVIFYAYIAINGLVLWKLVLVPLFRLLRIGRMISYEEAAKIIGSHFPEISDKLLNTLQLKNLQENQAGYSTDLIRASIDQKIEKLRPVPFTLAINLRQNLKYLRYALPPLVVFLLILAVSPSVITEPSERIVRYQSVYVPPAPFTIQILNEKLEAVQQDDFLLELKAEGPELPAELFVETASARFKMERKSPVNFQYRFRNIQENRRFHVVNDLFRSEGYELKVLPKPIVLSFDVSLQYPAYTGKVNETLENTGDLVLPAGTRINWRFYTRDTRRIWFRWHDEARELESEASNTFDVNERAVKSTTYSVSFGNEFLRNNDSLAYTVSVIPDSYPSISVEQVRDSVFDKKIYFRGLIKDDYGFSKLTFNYRHDADVREGESEEYIVELPVSKQTNQQQFFHFFDLDTINIKPGHQIAYHFEVWDNDGVNGAKVTRSQPMLFKAPTLEEIEKMTEEDNQQIKDELDRSIREARELQRKADELSRKLIEKPEIGWQEKQQIQDLFNEQKKLQERIENIQRENQIKSLQEQNYKQVDEELIRKQERLQELFDAIMNEELREMFEEMQQLMDKIDKDKVNEMLDKMKMDSKDLEKQLDRNLELFKQLEFEMKLQESIDKLKELAERQEDLGKQSDEEGADAQDLKEQQEELNEDFEKFREDLEELRNKNEELQEPNPMPDSEELEESIEQDMEEGTEMLEQGKPSKASPKQKSASGKMQEMAGRMEQMQSEMYDEELGESIEDLRMILENLLQLSFDQEGLLERTREITTIDPQYPSIMEEQKKIRDDLVMVEDSLWALSKRQQMIEPFITREIQSINHHVDRTLENLTERKKAMATENQQFVMTSINDLALLLSEALRQMMDAMQMQASGQCSKGSPKPGKGQASMKSMRQLQQQLNEQIQKMKEGMGKQDSPQQGERNTMNSEGFARMAAQQEAIRRMMEQYQEQMKEMGLGQNRELNDMMEQMEQTETELVNKMITQQTMERLKELETRLLKHEKAELKREMEEQRESREGKDVNNRNLDEFLEYNRLKNKEVELLRTVPPNLRPFYKEKVNQYFYFFELR